MSDARFVPGVGLGRVNAFGAAWMGLIFIPVVVPFLGARGVSVADVLTLQAVYGVAVMLFEVPTGYVCDIIGRRRTIVIGAALNLMGLAGFAAARGFGAYVAVELVLAAAWSLVSGADIALIYDILDLRGAGREARRHALANYVLAQVLGEAVASLVGGALAAWSMEAVGWAAALEAVLPLLLAVGLPGCGGGPAGAVSPAAIPRAIGQIFRDAAPRILFANMVVWSLSTFIAVWLLQPYWQEQGVGLRWFGVLWAATLVTVGIVSRGAPALTRAIGARGALLVLMIGPVVAYGGMAWFGGAAGIACGFLFYVSRGLNSVTLREAFNHQVPSGLRATCNSLTSGAFRLSYAVCGPLVGLLLDRAGLDAALGVLAGVFALAFAVLGVRLVRQS